MMKYKADGTIERFKARLLAKRYTQTYGFDYIETFALVAKINTVGVLLSLVTNLDYWPLQQFHLNRVKYSFWLPTEKFRPCFIPEEATW